MSDVNWVPISVRPETRRKLKLLCLSTEKKIEYDELMTHFIELYDRYIGVLDTNIQKSDETAHVNISVHPETRRRLQIICTEKGLEYDDLVNTFIVMWEKYKGAIHEDRQDN